MSKTSRVLVVGMNPSTYNTEDRDRKNHTFDRLKKWFTYANVDYFSFVNCCHVTGEVSARDVDYETLTLCLDGHERVVALGGFASNVLRKLNIKHHKLPHPSPRNRKFNDTSYEPLVMKDLKRYVKR